MAAKTDETTETLHFSISGEFITEHCRDRMFERGWEDAVRLLVNDLPGMTHEQAHSILNGELRLVGVNSCTPEAEDPKVTKEVQDRLAWHYAGTVFDGKHYFLPYAYVDNWGEWDVFEMTKVRNPYTGVPEAGIKGAGNSAIRSVPYMDKRDEDRAIWLKYDGGEGKSTVCVLFKRVSSPPIWMVPHIHEWQIALDAFVKAGGRLQHRGHQLWNPNWVSSSDQLKRITDAQKKVAKAEPTWQAAPLPAPDKECLSECGWIIPSGVFYPCAYSGHIRLAESIHKFVYETEPSNPEREGEQLGWVKVAYMMWEGKKDVMLLHESGVRLTKAARRTVFDWCAKHNEKLPFWYEEEEHGE